MTQPRTYRFRTVLASAALAALLFGAFLWPLPTRPASGIAYAAHVPAGTPPRELVQGDHLQLQYHFDLVHEMLAGRVRAFSNPYEFAVDPAAPAPRRVDPFYFPFALPYALLRFALPDALCWNFVQLLSVFLGVLFCHRLARRFGAGPGAAFAIAAVANCVPYRWVVLAGGSPTGFGMGLVPGVALGADLAVRDRSVRGGLLAGALLFCLYAADLHCFLFAALALPLWGALALLRAERGLRRPLGLAAPLAPVALGGALAGLLGFFAKAGYEGTDAAAGRTLREIERNSPDWHAFFDPSYFSHSPDQFYMGWALAALLVLAGLAAVFAAVAARRRRVATAAGFLLGGAILFVFLLALGTNGPLDALPLRLVRKLVPPFRLVRQPLKAFCLLPTLYAAFFALAWSLRPLSGRGRKAEKCGCSTFPLFRFSFAVLVCVLVFFSSRRDMRAGICLEPGRAHEAWRAIAEDARARGLEPRALVLPIWPGDSSWSSVYQYHAVRAGVPMLNGYAAVRTHDYAERVFGRFETMTEGDFTDDQAAGLREFGVTHVVLHENAFPAKVSPFPFGETLRRHLGDPRLRLVGWNPGVWAFAVCDREGDAQWPAALEPGVRIEGPDPAPVPPAATARHWRLDPPGTNAAVKLRSFAEIRREGCGWLVRAEADRDLVLVTSVPGSGEPAATNRFPAVEGAAPGSWRLAWVAAPFPGSNLWTRLETPGTARVSDLAFAENPAARPAADPLPFIPASGLVHEFGASRFLSRNGVSEPQTGLSFSPGRDPPCVAAEGPGLPLPLAPGRWRAAIEPADGAFRFADGAGLPGAAVSDDGRAVDFDYDGTAFADFRVLHDGTGGILHGIYLVPAGER